MGKMFAILLCLLLIAGAACHVALAEEVSPDGLHASIQREADSPEWVVNLPAAQDTAVTQLFIIAGFGMDKTSACVTMHQRDADGN